MAGKSKKTGLIVFFIIVALAIFSSVIQIVSSKRNNSGVRDLLKDNYFDLGSKNNNTTLVSKGTSSNKKDYIAEVVISGTIQEANKTYNQYWLLSTIASLAEDEHNKAIVLFIDSPGGTVYEADEVYLALLDYKKAGKPVYAYFGSMAASGGYYIGCASDYIMANRNTLTGSIGVISGNFIDLTGLMDNYGIKYTTITAGKNKNMGNYNEPMSQEQKEIMQSIADECYEQFTSIVADSRDMNIEEVKKLADGRIYTAKQALDNGLIDGIGSFDNIINYITHFEFNGEEYKVVKYEYEMEETFYSRLMGIITGIEKAKAASSSPLPEALDKALTPEVPFPSYYFANGRF